MGGKLGLHARQGGENGNGAEFAIGFREDTALKEIAEEMLFQELLCARGKALPGGEVGLGRDAAQAGTALTANPFAVGRRG